MTPLQGLIADLQSRVTKIDTHVDRLPTADELPDESYVKLLSMLQRSIEGLFQLLDALPSHSFLTDLGADKLSVALSMLRSDLRSPTATLIGTVDVLFAKYEEHLNSEQQKSARAIKQGSEELLDYIIALANQHNPRSDITRDS